MLLLCALFGNLAVIPLFVLVLSRQWVFGVINFLFVPEYAMAASEDNVNNKILGKSFCKLLDIYCVFKVVQTMLVEI